MLGWPRWFLWLAGLGLVAVPVIRACTSSYPIWGIRSDNADPLFRFKRGRKVGYVDAAGKIVIPPRLQYRNNSGGEFHVGLLDVGGGNYIDRSGSVAVRTRAQSTRDFSEGLAPASLPGGERWSGTWGFIDRTGSFVIPARFFWTYPFSDGLAMVSVSGELGSTGYINHQGEFVIPPKLTYGRTFREGLAAVILDGPCQMTNAGSCQRVEFAPTELEATYDCRFAFIDRNGRPISGLRFDDAMEFAEGLAGVRLGRQWGYVDKTGHMAIAARFEHAEPFSEGLAAVRLDGKMGFIDRESHFAIAPQFDSAEGFSSGRALVANRSQRGLRIYHFIGLSGQPAFPGSFSYATSFRHGLAHVKRHPYENADEWIDASGKTVFDPRKQ